MRNWLQVCIFGALVSSTCGAADLRLASKSVIHFASAAEGRKVLMTKDDFVRQLSSFDCSARMKTDKSVSDDEYLNFAAKSVVEWTYASHIHAAQKTRRIGGALPVCACRSRLCS
jgi:hypothetical protein